MKFKARRAWTLSEVLVVLALSGVVFLVVTDSLRVTYRITTFQNQRAAMQGQLQSMTSELAAILQRCTTGGISWQPAGPAVLALHCLTEGPVNGAPQWEPSYRCYIWDNRAQTLLFRQCPPGPPALTAPGTTQAQVLSVSDLATLTVNPVGARQVGQGVSNFTFSYEPGPLARFTIELERPIPGQTTFDKRQITRELTLRNCNR